MTRGTFTIAAVALCNTAAAAPQLPVTFESPCECRDNHGFGVREKESAFHPHAQRNACSHRCDYSLALCAQKVDTNRPFQFHKRRQLFISLHNKTLSIAAMRVSNPNRSPLRING